MKSNKKRTIKTQFSQSALKNTKFPSFTHKKNITLASDTLLTKSHLRYDTTLFHKTIFHLKPIQDNPEMFIRQNSISKKNFNILKQWRPIDDRVVLPHPVHIKLGISEMPNRDNMLREVTLNQITSKKWIIYSMQQDKIIKGYKFRLSHEVASISKILTFYTAYQIVKEYFISISTFEMIVTSADHRIGGTKLNLNEMDETLITLEDALYALILSSSNNIALAIANNLGNYLIKKRSNRYFSCFDVINQSRQNNINTFMTMMNKIAKQMDLKDSTFANPHGLTVNLCSALDVAKMASECFKIPLFCKISNTKRYIINPRYVNQDGEVVHRRCLLQNTNALLSKGCIGGKTGCNAVGRDSFVGCFEGGIMIVVLGCSGKAQKFTDCMRLWQWVNNKLKLSQQL